MKKVISVLNILIVLLHLSSCNEKDNISTDITSIDTPVHNNVPETIVRDKVILIDSSRLRRGFDNIYFGVPELQNEYKETNYTINDEPFSFYGYYMDEVGLFSFTLTGTYSREFESLSLLIQQTKSIIEKSYPKGEIIYEEVQSMLGQISSEASHRVDSEYHILNAPHPRDASKEVYLYKFLKNNISVKLGYIIKYEKIYSENFERDRYGNSYKPIIDYKKQYDIVLNFDDLQRLVLYQKEKNRIKYRENKDEEKRKEVEAKKF